MNSQLKLGHVFGVEIGLHYSWFVIALLITISLSGHFRSTHPDWAAGVVNILQVLRTRTELDV